MSNTKIVVLDGATLNPGDNPWKRIDSLGQVAVFDRTPPELVVERAQKAQVLVINKVKLPATVLEVLPELKLIAVTATGYDCVDVAAAKRLGIVVSNVPVYGTDSVAQHTFALILNHCHRVETHANAVRNGEWTSCPDFCFWKTPLIELADKTLGLIGFGRIAQRVAELAHAFGMRVIAHSRSQKNAPAWSPFTWGTLPEIFREADFLSLHCPLTPETKGLIRAETLSHMKPSAVLVNTSRGGLIVEADLAAALNNGKIAAAALDVLSVEPPLAVNPLLTAKNCTITPHNAWATLAARQRLTATTAENIAGFLHGRPQNVVDP
jgi:glycerate dehydrogenase